MVEKYQHCIFVCSNYTAGTRNGLHFLFNAANYNEVMNIVNKYAAKEGVSIYFVVTDSHTIDSVKNKDHFFKNINILEGTIPQNVISFNNSINNQISVMDVALLLLSREKMTVEQLKTYLFFIYCQYANDSDSFPFKEKCYFGKRIIGFKAINEEFDNQNPNALLRCTKPTIIMSKFFNTEKGVELMTKILHLFYQLKEIGVDKLSKMIPIYYRECNKKYRINNPNTRYPFTLRKKSIKALNIDIKNINN